MNKPDIKVVSPYVQNVNIVPTFVTGAFGGISHVGSELMVQFYVDRPKLPEYDEMVIDGNTQIVKSQKQVPAIVAHEKLVVFSAAMPEETVISLRNWLSAKINEYEQLRKDGQIR